MLLHDVSSDVNRSMYYTKLIVTLGSCNCMSSIEITEGSILKLHGIESSVKVSYDDSHTGHECNFGKNCTYNSSNTLSFDSCDFPVAVHNCTLINVIIAIPNVHY